MGDVLTKVQDFVYGIEKDDIQLLLKDNIHTVLIVAVTFGIYWLLKKPSGLPPGPRWTLPVVGDLLTMYDKSDNGDPRVALRRLRKKYGEICSVYFGPRLFIILNGYPVIKDALLKNGDIFSDRPHILITEEISKNKGIFGSSGKLWKEQRKFALDTLREFGFGRTILEDKIHEEIEVFVEVIRQKNGVPFEMCRLVQAAVSNVICSIVFGERFDYNNKVLQFTLKKAEENFQVLGSTQVVNFLPILRFLPGDLFKYHRTVKNVEMANALLIEPAIEEHLKNYNENNTNDFISCYLKEMKKNEKEGIQSNIDLINLKMSIGDLFIAGTETTSTTILWSILYLLHYPQVYQKCYKEIQDVIGSGRLPSVKDKVNMPYFEAFNMELLRHVNITLVGVPRAAKEDTVYQGYLIPKYAIVLPNIDSVLASDEIWGDASAFRPERFLDENGRVIHPEEWIPFSIGRRNCLGEGLAKMEQFLFLATLLQRFDFQAEDPQNIPPLKGEYGITHAPHKYNVRAVPR